tara:strand:+ start:380 stop:1030 length:651 start_codon:yes stop_codon:yes gene_type:complete
MIYFLFYVDAKVNKCDEIYLYDQLLTRTNLFRETFLKSPFYFDGTHLNEKNDKSLLEKYSKKKGAYSSYNKMYVPIALIEPQLRFEALNRVHYIDTFLPLHSNSCSINYYIVKEGNCKITFIHPKFKENFLNNDENLVQTKSKLDYIKKHEQFKTIVFDKNSIIYIPNNWILFIENNAGEPNPKKQCVLETIHYKTITNQIIGWVKNNIMKHHKNL